MTSRARRGRSKNRRTTAGSLLLWSACFCADSRAARLEEADERLARLIQKGNLTVIEKALRRIRHPLQDVALVVKRRHLSTAYPCLVDHRAAGTDPFINFFQECSPVIWAVDCLQWQVLPLLSRHGLDINRPQTCRRWTYICAPNSRPNTAPYRRFWTRGRYTYQSALDYFFASVYEFVGEQPASYNGLSGPSPLTFYFSHLPTLLTKGVDVHRIDSVIVFNSLATSYDQYLCRYTNEHATVPDIPENDDAFVEMTAVKRLIENGFSQFECMDYLYPCCNWFGILLVLMCHPKIDSYAQNMLPSIIRQATLLLINLLTLKCTFPSVDDFGESLENLHLRKVYSKRYGERRDEFNCRLTALHHICQAMLTGPLSLKLLARNALRKHIGGINFVQKLTSLNLPPQLISFVQYLGQEHLKSAHIPKQLIHFSQGEWVDVLVMTSVISFNQHNGFSERQQRAGYQRNNASETRRSLFDRRLAGLTVDAHTDYLPLHESIPAATESHAPTSGDCLRRFHRGRASERHHLPSFRRAEIACAEEGPVWRSGSLVRPTSAPLPLIRCLPQF